MINNHLRFISHYSSIEEMEENISNDIPNPSIGDTILADTKTFCYTGDRWELISCDFDKEIRVDHKIPIPSVEHKCKNCGATLEFDEQNEVFKCPYCKSKYSSLKIRNNNL